MYFREKNELAISWHLVSIITMSDESDSVLIVLILILFGSQKSYRVYRHAIKVNLSVFMYVAHSWCIYEPRTKV